MAGDDIWKAGDRPDGTLIRETFRVRDGGIDKVDETELQVPGESAAQTSVAGEGQYELHVPPLWFLSTLRAKKSGLLEDRTNAD